MTAESLFAPMRARIKQTELVAHYGTVTAIMPNAIEITGLNAVARVGDEVISDDNTLRAEITRLTEDIASAAPLGSVSGIRLGAKVRWCGPPQISPHESWLGQVLDPFGVPMDHSPLTSGLSMRSLTAAPPRASE